MRLLICALVCLLASPLCVVAQDKPAASLEIESYGSPASEVLRGFAASAGLEFSLQGQDVDLDQSVWIRARGVTAHEGLRLLQIATGCNVVIKENKLVVREDGDFKPLVVTRGYDVSILAGRFVDYVNRYGEPAKPEDEEDGGLNYTAAERLAELVQAVGETVCERKIDWAAAGDRVLFMTDEATHAWIRDFLGLMAADQGGARAVLAREARMLEALRAAQFASDFEELPLASVVSDFCRRADADFVIHYDLVTEMSDMHVDHRGSGSALTQLETLFASYIGDTVGVSTSGGVLLVRDRAASAAGDEHVYDVSALLARLDAAFKRQRTAPGKSESYDGDAAGEGGSTVIVRALRQALKSQGEEVLVFAYGTRLVAIGDATQIKVVEQILKETGWEPPAE